MGEKIFEIFYFFQNRENVEIFENFDFVEIFDIFDILKILEFCNFYVFFLKFQFKKYFGNLLICSRKSFCRQGHRIPLVESVSMDTSSD